MKLYKIYVGEPINKAICQKAESPKEAMRKIRACLCEIHDCEEDSDTVQNARLQGYEVDLIRVLDIARLSMTVVGERDIIGGKLDGHMLKKTEDGTAYRVPLRDKRLLSVAEFQAYTSIGRNNAFKLIRQAGCEVRVGRRVFADRAKFDAWCETQEK